MKKSVQEQKDTDEKTADLVNQVKSSAQKIKKTAHKLSLHEKKKEKKAEAKAESKAMAETEDKEKKQSLKSVVTPDTIEEDKHGKFIEVSTETFKKNKKKVKRLLDKNSEAKIDGLTLDEMEEKERREKKEKREGGGKRERRRRRSYVRM